MEIKNMEELQVLLKEYNIKNNTNMQIVIESNPDRVSLIELHDLEGSLQEYDDDIESIVDYLKSN